MKTRHPLILTARIAEEDLASFDALRQKHFPPTRNFLRAHLTMFHRLPGEYVERIIETLRAAAAGRSSMTAQVAGVRHLGAGVAFTIECPELIAVRDVLRNGFVQWLGSQDMQAWKPHITIQNKVSRQVADALFADALFKEQADGFQPHSVVVTGLDLWRYLDGPWAHAGTVAFDAPPPPT